MRFNSQAYDKVFPRQNEVHEHVETAVETFRPSEQADDLNEETQDVVVEDVSEPSIEEQGGDADGGTGELDGE